MASLDDLRALVKRRHVAVTKKVSRIKRTSGALISGTSFDPRTPASEIKGMSESQLRNHLVGLNSFLARGNQFSSGNRGVPLPRDRAKVLINERGKALNLGQERENKIGKYPLPGVPKGDIENTVGSQRAQRGQRMSGMAGEPFPLTPTDLKKISGADALEKLIRQAEQQSSPGYLKRAIKGHREEMDKALEIMGETDLRNQIMEFSDFQFDVMWGTGGFAEEVFSKYDIFKKQARGEEIDSDSESVNIGEFLEWARSTIPRDEKGY